MREETPNPSLGLDAMETVVMMTALSRYSVYLTKIGERMQTMEDSPEWEMHKIECGRVDRLMTKLTAHLLSM